MLTPAMRAVRGLSPGQTIAVVIVACAALYALAFLDPYIALIMTPFFALGCARGKHPLTLLSLSLAPALILLAVSAIKFSITGMPLVTYDHYFLRQNVLLLAYNDWRVATALIMTTAATLLYIKHLFSGRAPFTRFEKWSLAALAVVSIISIFGVRRWDQDIFNWEKELGTPTLRTLVKSSQIPKPRLQMPPKTAARAQLKNLALGLPAGGAPDIFIVLQESTVPPEVLKPGYEPHTLFNTSAPHTGRLHVHTFAGGTWKTEFSVTTQMRPQEFGNDGLYVFHQLEGRIKRSLFTQLKELGYRTMVFYPVPGNFINARSFYASIGVDEFYDPESLGISKGWDWKIPDATFYDTMLKKIGDSDKPVVAMMLTINQHGPYDVPDPITDYLGRFAASDDAYSAFLESLAQRGRKAGVFTFGDHQPEFTARFLEDRATWYYTAYDIRCVNFACTPQAIQGNKPLDIVLLPSAALEAFGFKLDDFSLLQRKLFEACDDNIERCNDNLRLDFNSAFAKFFD